MAEAFKEAADELEKADEFQMAVHDLIKKLFSEHRRIIFNGNGYDDAWIQEATLKRGLSNYPCTPDCVPHILDRKNVFMRVWERGTGETLACGTGCCATAVACVLNGLTDEEITVKLLGGELHIKWDRKENLVYMTGPAKIVFEGEVDPYSI